MSCERELSISENVVMDRIAAVEDVRISHYGSVKYVTIFKIHLSNQLSFLPNVELRFTVLF